MSVNKAIILGNVCADPIITTFDNGGKVAQFSVATNKRGYTTRDGREIPEQTEFHNVVVNRSGLVGVVENFVRKGIKIYIEGEMRTRIYQAKNGEQHRIMEIYASEMELCTPKQDHNAPAPAPENDPFAPNTGNEAF